MHVMIVGASGLIGSAVRARLAARGDTLLAVVHRPADLGLLPAAVMQIDLARASEADWLPRLSGVDAVVNCAGLLQDAPGDSTRGVHAAGAAALFRWWFAFGFPAFAAVLAIFWLMIAKPQLPFL